MTSVTTFRRDLHRIPELGYQEHKTQQYIKDSLTKLGISFGMVCKTGVYSYIDRQKKRTIAIRADIDGLPIGELTRRPFKSEHEGYMHACGHDGHTALVLGLAELLSTEQIELDCNVLLLFQPAEEGPGGAKDIVQSGLLEQYKVECVYGLHLFPDIPQGQLGIKSGAIMAQVCEFQIYIDGKAAHGAEPHQGVDSILIGAEIVQKLQFIRSRLIDPREPYVLTVGKIEGGQRRNIIAPSLMMDGTIRAFDMQLMQQSEQHITKLCLEMETLYGCQIKLDFHYDYPPVINDQKKTEQLIRSFDKHSIPYQIVPPQMLAEDFSYYGKAVPSVFFFLGIKNEDKGYTYPLHSPQFDFDDENVLPWMLNVWKTILPEL